MFRTYFILSSFIFFAFVSVSAQIQLTTYEDNVDDSQLIFFTTDYDSYLINRCGDIMNQWEHEERVGLTGLLTHDGYLLRTASVPGCCPQSSQGGLLELIDYSGEIKWSYEFASDTITQHHDVNYLPNGNILFLGWEVLTMTEKIDLGKENPEERLWSEFVYEIKPLGTDSFELVWEWHLKNHLIQDIDPFKENFVQVDTAIRKIDINYKGPFIFSIADWWHANALDYNAARDEIIISSRSNGEFWIIDHSTTSAEARTDSGGARNKGGQLLYRWGNPAAYGRGTSADYKMYGAHGTSWIKEGLQDEGKIIFFNNGDIPQTERFSTVDIMTPRIDSEGDYVVEDFQFSYDEHIKVYGADLEKEFMFSIYMSNAQQLNSGGYLVNATFDGGRLFEVNSDNEIIWSINTGAYGETFKAFLYDQNYSGFEGIDFDPMKNSTAGEIISSSNNLCEGPVELKANTIDGKILWSTGDTVETIIVDEVGIYSYTATGKCGENFSPPYEVIERPVNDRIYGEMRLCENKDVILTASTYSDSLIWSNGETTRLIKVEEPGLYYYDAYDYCSETIVRSETHEVSAISPLESVTETVTAGEDHFFTMNSSQAGVFWYESETIREPFDIGRTHLFENLQMDTTVWVATSNSTGILGCLSARVPMYLDVISTSSEGLSTAASITIYPNPVQDELWVVSSSDEPITMEVFNIYGSKLLFSRGSKLDLRAISPGCYFLRILDNKGQILKCERIVKL